MTDTVLPDPVPGRPAPHRRLSASLATLHRVLLDAQAAGSPEASNPYALLQAVLHDPSFVWLRALSGLMAKIDEAGARGVTPPPETLATLVSEAGDLTEREGEVRTKLADYASRPGVAAAAAALEATLAELRRAGRH